MKYEYLGFEKKVRIKGVKYHFVPGEEYDFKENPGPSFRKVVATKKTEETVNNGTDS